MASGCGSTKIGTAVSAGVARGEADVEHLRLAPSRSRRGAARSMRPARPPPCASATPASMRTRLDAVTGRRREPGLERVEKGEVRRAVTLERARGRPRAPHAGRASRDSERSASSPLSWSAARASAEPSQAATSSAEGSARTPSRKPWAADRPRREAPTRGRRATAGAPSRAWRAGRRDGTPARGARAAGAGRPPPAARRPRAIRRRCGPRACAAARRTRSTERDVGEPVAVAQIELARRGRERQIARRRVVRVADEQLPRALDPLPGARGLGVDVVVEQAREQQRGARVHARRRDVDGRRAPRLRRAPRARAPPPGATPRRGTSAGVRSSRSASSARRHGRVVERHAEPRARRQSPSASARATFSPSTRRSSSAGAT